MLAGLNYIAFNMLPYQLAFKPASLSGFELNGKRCEQWLMHTDLHFHKELQIKFVEIVEQVYGIELDEFHDGIDDIELEVFSQLCIRRKKELSKWDESKALSRIAAVQDFRAHAQAVEADPKIAMVSTVTKLASAMIRIIDHMADTMDVALCKEIYADMQKGLVAEASIQTITNKSNEALQVERDKVEMLGAMLDMVEMRIKHAENYKMLEARIKMQQSG